MLGHEPALHKKSSRDGSLSSAALCVSLRLSAFSALMGLSTQRAAEIRRGRRENKSDLPLLCKAARASNHLPLDQSSTMTRLSQCPSQIFARFSASNDENVELFYIPHVSSSYARARPASSATAR